VKAVALSACAMLLALAAPAAVTGTLSAEDGTPIVSAYTALLGPGFTLAGDAVTDAAGGFSIDADIADGFLLVQPPTAETDHGVRAFSYQPRLYQYAGETELELKLPQAVNLVLEAFDAEGNEMLWQDFEALGTHGGQFVYATNLHDQMVEATVWPVHGEGITGAASGPRETGVPAILVEPGQLACINVLFWPTLDYGKLLLRDTNSAQGYTLDEAGATLRINLNEALAESAVRAMEERLSLYPEGAERIAALRERLDAIEGDDPSARASAADPILSEALRLRDELELQRARAAIPAVRTGRLAVRLENAEDPTAYTVTVSLERGDFLFGAYEGSPYNGDAWTAARELGFDYATVLPAWNWTRNPKLSFGAIDRTFGLSALQELGYWVKAHGVVWMQDYGILPEEAKAMSREDLVTEATEHQEALLEALDEYVEIWEVINEPATTNVVNLPRQFMMAMMSEAASNIREAGKPSLINNPHEFSYGSKYFLHGLDDEPVNPYPTTYSEYLSLAEDDGLLDEIDIVGLQFYPGFHLNADFGNQEGPAFTPSHLLDTLNRYTKFGKSIHITELSLPSSYGEGWNAGYWKRPWDEATQAEYAEAVYTLAFAHPQVHSVTWWDISDAKPSVITGALLTTDGQPKPVAETIQDLMDGWRTNESKPVGEDGVVEFRPYGGRYTVTVAGPDGFERTLERHVLERWQGELVVDVKAES